MFLKQNICTGSEMPLTPNFFFLLKRSTSFPDFISKKIISIDKILAFLKAFEHVISMFTTAQSGIWVGATSDVTSVTELKHSKDFILSLEGYQNISGLFVIHILSKSNKTFYVKDLYHLALQFEV